ncbi:MAG: hypothetical protein ACO3CL_05190 [Bacteroidia bacterium]
MTTPRSPYPRLQRIFYLLSSVYCMVLGTGVVQAQTNEFFGSLEWEQRNAGSLPEFYNGYSLGGGLHSSGWWLGGKWIQNRTFATESQVEVSLFRWKHPNAFKTQANSDDRGSAYTPGLLNEAFSFQAGWGTSYLWMERGLHHGVELRGTWSAGLSLALLKPVYLQIIYANEDPETSKDQPFIQRAEAYEPTRHNAGNIAGASSFFKGFDSLGVVPGLYAKGGLVAQWGQQRKAPMSVEIGLMGGVYIKPLTVMAFVDRTPLLACVYLSYQMGRRY